MDDRDAQRVEETPTPSYATQELEDRRIKASILLELKRLRGEVVRLHCALDDLKGISQAPVASSSADERESSHGSYVTAWEDGVNMGAKQLVSWHRVPEVGEATRVSVHPNRDALDDRWGIPLRDSEGYTLPTLSFFAHRNLARTPEQNICTDDVGVGNQEEISAHEQLMRDMAQATITEAELGDEEGTGKEDGSEGTDEADPEAQEDRRADEGHGTDGEHA